MGSDEKKLLNLEEDQFDRLGRLLGETTALMDRVPVYVGTTWLAELTAGPRIVLLPTTGDFQAPADKGKSIVDEKLLLIAACWGETDRETREVRNLLFQALEEQRSRKSSDGLFFISLQWEYERETWLINSPGADTTITGAGVEVYFFLIVSVDRVPSRIGRVDSTTLTEV